MVRVEINLDRPLSDFEWSVRTGGCFLNEGIETIRDLVQRTEASMLRVPNFGEKSLLEVKHFLVDRGLRLGMDVGPRKRRAEKVTEFRLCVARVRLSTIPTLTRRQREAKAERRGHPPDQCGEDASHFVDGQPLCRSHAATRALHILEEMV